MVTKNLKASKYIRIY